MEYIPVMVAFIAALFAIVGNTWNPAAVGMARLTSIGWCVLVCVVLSFGFSVHGAYEQRNQKQAEALEKKKVNRLVASEIDASLHELLEPFKMLYAENQGIGYVDPKTIKIDMMLEPAALAKAQDTCFFRKPVLSRSFPDQGTWNDIFGKSTDVGLNKVRRLQELYANRMEADTLAALRDITSRMTSNYARTIATNERPVTAIESVEKACQLGRPIDVHKRYLTMLKRLEELNQPHLHG